MPVSLRMKNLLQKNVSYLESNEAKGCRDGVKGSDRKDGIGMKKLLVLLLSVAMVFSFAGCGEEDNSNDADVFNGVLFDGRVVMKPEELETVDSVITYLPETENGKKVIADKICKWCSRYVSVVVLENQSYVDYRMVLRVMEAEVMNYEKQRREQYQQNKQQGYEYRNDEYLSKMKKEQKLIPIITLVLYLGKDKLWDGAKSLHEMLEMDEEVKPFVNDFKINLFDYHDCMDFSKFQTENRLLFEMLSCQKDKEKMKDILKRRSGDRR